ncbi:Eco47II family restriction endonuclease [uncultured Shewanella sp.]|uniref:Eco47II family restriction endonuclease n=1 Tax=uncultured Shewanella sp. TaxID=173975 RepID=UPI00260E6C5A|nr:Eco47II family restriction endonuclease [uncultured Shewanella sp.]
MAYLNYLEDDKITSLVKEVLDIGINKKKSAIKDFSKNVIDPFSALFDSAVSEVDHETWKNTELVRQCQKTLVNHIGNLHQKILGEVDDWKDLGVGGVVDLVCHNQKIIAEVKNKYNTVTGGKLADQYYSLERLVNPKNSQYKGYTAYFVNIIPKKPVRFNECFQPSDKEKGLKCQPLDSIRIIDGASFYSLVTGRNDALLELYNALPLIIENIYRSEYKQPTFSLPNKQEFKQYFNDAFVSLDD